jgi:hypothetical protein
MKQLMDNHRTAGIRWRAIISSAMAVTLLFLVVENALADPAGYMLPWTANTSFTITQGWNSSPSHTGNQYYAYDFGLPSGTVVRAARAGTVRYTRSDVVSCSFSSTSNVNYVIIDHSDGTATQYLHLQNIGVLVAPGQIVHQGAIIGMSGATGFTSCGPHLHFQRQNQGTQFGTSQSVYFEEYPGEQFLANSSRTARNFDFAVLLADAPLPGAYAAQRLEIRPQQRGDDFRIYPISGGPSPWDGWNDDPSSIHVPEGVVVSLYADITYGGFREDFSSTDKWLPDNAIGNDNASSMRYDGVWLFEHLNYNADASYVAKAEFFRGNDDYLPDNYVFNDNVTSMTIGHGWQVTVYQHAWYTGNQLVLGAGTYPDFRQFYCGCGGDNTWNDQASSIQVYRVGP